MTTGVVEVTRLEDLVTLDPPPCEIFFRGEPCGKPSVYRLYRECACGLKSTRFVCHECFTELINGNVNCHMCLLKITEWRVI